MVKPTSPPKQPMLERSTLMTDGEFDAFWAGLAFRGHGSASAGRQPPDKVEGHGEVREAAANRSRPNKPTLQRCGTCRGCTANDCGACKNCRDKPRFGGPGIKKKACLRRVCDRARIRGSDEDDDEDDAVAPPTTTMLSAAASCASEPASAMTSVVNSPSLRPSSPSDVLPGSSDDACGDRAPLEALHAQLNAASDNQLDMLSRMASSIGAV